MSPEAAAPLGFTWTGPRPGHFAAGPAPLAAPAGLAARTRWYAVGAVPDADTVGPLSAPVAAAPAAGGEAAVAVRVDAARPTGPLHRPWRAMIGSEHLSHMLSADRTGGRVIGEELTEALRIVHDELGVAAVRAHGILDDDLGTYREVNGRPAHDFTGIDRVYDHLLGVGPQPVVELAYMPRDLARDPDHTVFYYQGVSSPPKDWDHWEDLVRDLVQHLVDRYGLQEVRDHWAF